MNAEQHFHAVFESPVGRLGLRLSADGKALSALKFLDDSPLPAQVEPAAREFVRALQDFFADPQRDLNLPLAEQGTDFQRRVWRALRQMPTGTTQSYGAMAKELGSGPRAVASACRTNPIPIVTPCHRLIGANGSLTGYCGRTEGEAMARKAWLIDHEASA